MREKDIEAKLVREVNAAGGLCWKFVSPGNTGVPDRIVVTPKGKVWFVELKAAGGTLTPRQKKQLEALRLRGANVTVLRGEQEADWFVEFQVRRGGLPA